MSQYVQKSYELYDTELNLFLWGCCLELSKIRFNENHPRLGIAMGCQQIPREGLPWDPAEKGDSYDIVYSLMNVFLPTNASHWVLLKVDKIKKQLTMFDSIMVEGDTSYDFCKTEIKYFAVYTGAMTVDEASALGSDEYVYKMHYINKKTTREGNDTKDCGQFALVSLFNELKVFLNQYRRLEAALPQLFSYRQITHKKGVRKASFQNWLRAVSAVHEYLAEECDNTPPKSLRSKFIRGMFRSDVDVSGYVDDIMKTQGADSGSNALTVSFPCCYGVSSYGKFVNEVLSSTLPSSSVYCELCG